MREFRTSGSAGGPGEQSPGLPDEESGGLSYCFHHGGAEIRRSDGGWSGGPVVCLLESIERAREYVPLWGSSSA